MCVQPINIPDKGDVACHECWQCRNNRVNDLVGRCIAEQEKATLTLAVTLTYAGDEVNASTLVYRDFQLFLKRLRKKGYKVRYIVAGEYGTKKGRAHWHAVLFFHGKSPKVVPKARERMPWDIVLPRWNNDPEARIQWEPWPHGFVYCQYPEYEGFQYCIKYALKDQRQRAARMHLAMSKKPPLGDAFFRERAREHVKQGLAPRSFEYSFPHVFDKDGKRRKFWIQGKTRENYIQEFLSEWHRRRGEQYPFTELLNEQILAGALSEQHEAEASRAPVKLPLIRSRPVEGALHQPPWLGGEGAYEIAWWRDVPVMTAENKAGWWICWPEYNGRRKTWLVNPVNRESVQSELKPVRTAIAEERWRAKFNAFRREERLTLSQSFDPNRENRRSSSGDNAPRAKNGKAEKRREYYTSMEISDARRNPHTPWAQKVLKWSQARCDSQPKKGSK